MDFLDTYIDAIYGGVPRKMVDKYGNEFVDAVVTGAETVIPFNLADPLRPFLESFVQPDKPNPAVGSSDSKGKFYAGENFGYQTPDSYKDIFKAFPKAYVDLQKAKQEAEKKKEQESLPDVGDFRSPDNKYFTNENYGFQSPDSYNKVIGSYPAGYVKPSTTPAMPGNKTAPISNVGVETKTPTSLEELFKFFKEERKAGLEEKAISFGRQQQIADQYAQISMAKSVENTARQVELENIKRWREIGIAQIEAQTRSTALTAGLMTMLQQPNVNFMGALSTAFDSGAAPFAGRVRRG
jgi:hypothetical protein